MAWVQFAGRSAGRASMTLASCASKIFTFTVKVAAAFLDGVAINVQLVTLTTVALADVRLRCTLRARMVERLASR